MKDQIKQILRDYLSSWGYGQIDDDCLDEVLLYDGEEKLQCPANTTSDYDEIFIVKEFRFKDGTEYFLKYKYARNNYDGYLDNYKFDGDAARVYPTTLPQTVYTEQEQR